MTRKVWGRGESRCKNAHLKIVRSTPYVPGQRPTV